MKISICYIQYNRIQYLLKSLEILELQVYPNIEIVISDDASTDDTLNQIQILKEKYKYPIIYERSDVNQGFDRNYRKCIELATGEYCIVLGNDDTIVDNYAVQNLVKFIYDNNFPDIGFINYFEFITPSMIVERAKETIVLGSGVEVALKYYNCFSFVGGLIYKKSTFNKFNSDVHDGSIYAQMHLGMTMIIGGSILFSIKEPVIGKDIIIDKVVPNSYKDNLIRNWAEFKIVDGGLHSVIKVIISALELNRVGSKNNLYYVFKRMYSRTFPYWIFNYKRNKALPSAVGLVLGLLPTSNSDFYKLTLLNKSKIFALYFIVSFVSILVPSRIFFLIEKKLYKI